MNIVVVGTGNIGLTTAQRLAAEHRLVLVDRRRHDALARFLESTPTAHFVEADACDPEAMERAIGRSFPGERLDRLLCSVGTRSEAAADSDFPGFARDFETNLFGNQIPVMAALPRMKSQGGGKIAVISSTSGHHAPSDLTAYGPSKWALEAFCGGLRSEEHGHGIAVDTVTLTNLGNRHSDVFETATGLDPDDVADRVTKHLLRSTGSAWTHPAHYRAVHWLERLAPGRLDARAGLPRGRAASHRARAIRRGLITGASSGLGRELALRYAKRLETLWLVARTGSALDAVKREIESSTSCRVETRALDLGDLDAVASLADRVSSTHGCLDLLVNNAGRHLEGAIAETPVETVRALMASNFLGPALLLGRLRERGQLPAKVIDVISTTAVAGRSRLSAYGGSKAALWCFTRSLRRVAGSEHQVLEVIPATFASGLFEKGIRIAPSDGANPAPGSVESRTPPAARELTAEEVAARIEAAEAAGREHLFVPFEARLFLLLEALAPPVFRRLFP